MTGDPFDEFRKIEKMFQKIMGNSDFTMGGTSRGISIQKMGDKTKVDVHGDISERELERLRNKYPNAEISVNGETIESSDPVEVLDEESEKANSAEEIQEFRGPKIEEVDEEEMDSQKLALKRFKEKREDESQDS